MKCVTCSCRALNCISCCFNSLLVSMERGVIWKPSLSGNTIKLSSDWLPLLVRDWLVGVPSLLPPVIGWSAGVFSLLSISWLEELCELEVTGLVSTTDDCPSSERLRQETIERSLSLANLGGTYSLYIIYTRYVFVSIRDKDTRVNFKGKLEGLLTAPWIWFAPLGILNSSTFPPPPLK